MSKKTTLTLNFFPSYRVRAIEGKYLLTGSHGRWTVLTDQEYHSLTNNTLPPELFSRLQDRGLIFTGNNQSRISELFRSWNKYYFENPTLHIVVTTRRCNLRCVYCHAASRPSQSDREDLTAPISEKIVDFIFDSPAKSMKIEFQGGESLLNFDAVRRLVANAKAKQSETGKNVTFSLVSNITLLDQAKLDFIKTHNIRLSTSVDGPAHIHNRQRPFEDGTGSFDRVMSQIEWAKSQGVQIGVLSVLTPDFLPEYREIIDQHVRLGMEQLCLNPVMSLGRAGRPSSKIRMPPEKFIKYYGKILDYSFESLQEGKMALERWFVLALDKVTGSHDIGFKDFRSPCGALFGQIVYDVNGDIYPCDEARGFPELKLGNVTTHRYEDLVESEKAWELITASLHNDTVCDRCAYEPFCGLCPIWSYSDGQGLRPRPPNDFRCQLNQFLFDYVFKKIIQYPEEIAIIQRYRALSLAYNRTRQTARESTDGGCESAQ